MMWDVIKLQQETARKEIEAIEDKKVYDSLLLYAVVDNLGKALRDIPNTKWKKIKYYTKRLFGLIK